MFVYLIATSLQIPGMLFNVGPLAGLGPALSTTNATFALAVLITVIFMVFTVLGSRAIRTLFYVAWAAEVVGIVVMWGLLATTSPDVFAKAWDASFLGQALPHGQVISTAITNGYKVVPDFSWEITLASLPLGPLFFFGYYYSTIVAGEVKDIRKSIPISIFGVFALTYVWWAVSATLNLKALGAQWFYALSYLWEITPNAWSSLGLPTPTMNLMLSLMAFPNMWLVALISITFILASTPMVYLFFFLQTRYFFAWGFDRVVPTRLAEVNRRYRTPVNATIALGILTVLLLFLYLYTGWSTLYTMMVFQQTLTFIGPSIAAIVFPFVLKSLFESLPPVLRARVGRVPLISVVGVVCAVFFAYLSYVFYATPQIAVPSMWGIAFLIATFVFAIALYLGSRAYWRSKGVAIDLAFKELPPD
jgi:amino acid transporter